MTVTLEPMTAERYASWVEHLIASYADDNVNAGNWPAGGALERARRECDELLPRGVATPHHDLLIGTVEGVEVGYLWLFTNPDRTPREAFIYDIEIAAEQRGKGHGRGLLEAGERWCVERGVVTVKLHVFGFNATAIRLYKTSGYEVTNLNMAKRLTAR